MPGWDVWMGFAFAGNSKARAACSTSRVMKWERETRSPPCQTNRGFLLGFTRANLYIARRPKPNPTKNSDPSPLLSRITYNVFSL